MPDNDAIMAESQQEAALPQLPEGNSETSASAAHNRNDTNNTWNNLLPPLDPVLIERFTHNRSIDGPWYHVLIVLYSIIIVFGALGNTMVVLAVVRKPAMRTARNLFILNLAISGKCPFLIY